MSQKMSTRRSGSMLPTVESIFKDRISQVAREFWAPYAPTHKPYDPSVIVSLYHGELRGTNFAVRRIMLLEYSQYLERYLWPNFRGEEASIEHVLSIVVMVNEKFRERVPAWEHFKQAPGEFPAFFRRVLELCLDTDESHLSLREQTALLVFLIYCFGSVEVEVARTQVQKVCGLSIWENLLPAKRDELLRASPKLSRYWNALRKKEAKKPPTETELFERRFLTRLIETRFFPMLECASRTTDEVAKEGEQEPMEQGDGADNVPEKAPDRPSSTAVAIRYCERFLELVIDLESLLPTRRFFNALLDNLHFVSRCTLSPLARRRESDGRLFCQLLDMLEFYVRFEVDDLSGDALNERETTERHYARLLVLQRAIFNEFGKKDDADPKAASDILMLREFALLNVASVDTRKALNKYFATISENRLRQITACLNISPAVSEDDSEPDRVALPKELLLESLIARHERRQSQLDALNEMPLYPTEQMIWDAKLIPATEFFSGDDCLALNKLNLQFLTLHDYLLRNFSLFRLETTYEIRKDIEDAVLRMKPWKHEDAEFKSSASGSVVFAESVKGIETIASLFRTN